MQENKTQNNLLIWISIFCIPIMPNGQTEHVRLRTDLFHNFALILFYPQVRQGSLDRSKKILEIFGKNDEIKADGFRRRSEGSLKIEKMEF